MPLPDLVPPIVGRRSGRHGAFWPLLFLAAVLACAFARGR
jgi:hypothetical protein